MNIRWLNPAQEQAAKDAIDSRSMLVYDHFERPIILFANDFTLNYFRERHNEIELTEALDVTN